jgi:hypothetical protein
MLNLVDYKLPSALLQLLASSGNDKDKLVKYVGTHLHVLFPHNSLDEVIATINILVNKVTL